MNIGIKKCLLGLSFLMLAGCGSEAPQSKAISIESMPLVINLLDKDSYNDCHIVGSVHVDFDIIESYVENIDKDTEIILYCSNYACGTSDYVGRQLLKLGYTNVSAYEGGMAEWKQNGLPTVGPGKAAYLTRVMVQSNEHNDSPVPVISMNELAEKLHIDSNA